MKPDVAIISCITGDYDTLKPIPTKLPCCLVAEKPIQNCEEGAMEQWKHIPIERTVVGNERLSRMPKCMPWQFVDAKITIWTDASVRWLKDPAFLVKYVEKNDIAGFSHPERQ